MSSRTEIEVPSCSSMLRERGLAGEQMNSSEMDPPKPDPKTVLVMYAADIETPPVSPKGTHGWVFKRNSSSALSSLSYVV